MLEWSDDLKIGETEIDKEHWGLFALIHDLQEKHTHGATDASIDTTLDALTAYVEVHFEHEERLMEETGYPELESHKQAHAMLKKQVHGFMKDLHNSPSSMVLDALMNFLSTWLTNHIGNVDMAFARYHKNL